MSTGAKKIVHPWSTEAYLGKAQRYAATMLEHPKDDWRFGLNSSFVLEFLARAALARISPALVADTRDWNNVYFALGHKPTAQKFIPKTSDISAVLSRLREPVPTFTAEHEGFALKHINSRNEELHAGSTPFDGVGTNWLAPFYEACEVLLASIGAQLDLLLGKEEAKAAREMIKASHDESAKAVGKAIAAYKTVWESKDQKERTKLQTQATAWATRESGHRVVCPACSSDALVSGTPISAPLRKLDGDLIVETQEYLPSKFECVACQLKVSGLSQLNAALLGTMYRATSTYDAVEYYSPEVYPEFEEDNND